MTAMRQPPATRRFARELALRALYQADVLEEPAAKAFADVLEEPSPLDPDEIVAVVEELAEGASFPVVELDRAVIEFARRLVRVVDEHRADIDTTLDSSALNWSVRRMSAVDRNVLRLGAAEILYCPDVPLNVALSEAISLAKRYGGQESGAFVNGVLDRIAATMRGSTARAPGAILVSDEDPEGEGDASIEDDAPDDSDVFDDRDALSDPETPSGIETFGDSPDDTPTTP